MGHVLHKENILHNMNNDEKNQMIITLVKAELMQRVSLYLENHYQ